MSLFWLRQWAKKVWGAGRKGRGPRQRRRPVVIDLESLEDRRLLSGTSFLEVMPASPPGLISSATAGQSLVIVNWPSAGSSASAMPPGPGAKTMTAFSSNPTFVALRSTPSSSPSLSLPPSGNSGGSILNSMGFAALAASANTAPSAQPTSLPDPSAEGSQSEGLSGFAGGDGSGVFSPPSSPDSSQNADGSISTTTTNPDGTTTTTTSGQNADGSTWTQTTNSDGTSSTTTSGQNSDGSFWGQYQNSNGYSSSGTNGQNGDGSFWSQYQNSNGNSSSSTSGQNSDGSIWSQYQNSNGNSSSSTSGQNADGSFWGQYQNNNSSSSSTTSGQNGDGSTWTQTKNSDGSTTTTTSGQNNDGSTWTQTQNSDGKGNNSSTTTTSGQNSDGTTWTNTSQGQTSPPHLPQIINDLNPSGRDLSLFKDPPQKTPVSSPGDSSNGGPSISSLFPGKLKSMQGKLDPSVHPVKLTGGVNQNHTSNPAPHPNTNGKPNQSQNSVPSPTTTTPVTHLSAQEWNQQKNYMMDLLQRQMAGSKGFLPGVQFTLQQLSRGKLPMFGDAFAAVFDDPALHNKAHNQQLFTIPGSNQVFTGHQLNYYFQGMYAAAHHQTQAQLDQTIQNWKNNRTLSPTDPVYTAAHMGYQNYQSDLSQLQASQNAPGH